MSEEQSKTEKENYNCSCGSGSSSGGSSTCCPFSNVDWKGIYEKVASVTTKPFAFFEQEKLTEISISDLYKKYFVVLAAITPICSFIKYSIIGTTVLGITYRTGFFHGLVTMVFLYLFSLAFLYLFAIVIEQLSKSFGFGGSINRENAFKLFAFSLAPAFVAGFLVVLGPLSLLSIFFFLYSIYIFYLGSPIMGACSEEKKLPFTATVAVSYIVISFIIGSAVSFSTPDAPKTGQIPEVNFNLNVPQQGQVSGSN